MKLLKNKKNCRGLILSNEQLQMVRQIQEKEEKRIYKKENNFCICGSHSDELIATNDRYGIDVNTVICKNCGLIRTNPYYTQETLNEFYNEEYRKLYVWGERNDEDFFKNQSNTGMRYLKNIQETLKCNFDSNIVYEIGCGMGGILKPFKDNGCTIKGVDLGNEYIEIGKNKHQLDLITGDYNTLKNFEKANLIILSHVLEHIVKPVEFLKDLRNLIEENGLLYIAVPTIETIKTAYQGNIFHYLQNAHIYDFSIETLRYVMELAGFKPINIIESEGTIIARKNNNYRSLDDVPKQEYNKMVKLLTDYETKFKNKDKVSFIETLFSVKNEYRNNKKIKILRILGIKIKWEQR